jgi:hypothetical protein
MSCAARELGRFLLAKEKRPEPLLEEHMLGRCGSSASSVAYATFGGETTEDETALYQRFGEELAKWMKEAPPNARFGAAVVRGDGKRTFVVGLYSVPHVVLETTSQIAVGGKVRIAGTADTSRGRLVGVAAALAQGALGVTRCEADPSVLLPRFVFVCPVSGEDAARAD